MGIAHLPYMQMIANYIRLFEDITSLQDDLDEISDCCKKNKMKVNVKKCKIMRITRKKSPLVRDCHINGQSLDSVDIYKDLGLLTSCNLSWNSHIGPITARANRVSWFGEKNV